MIKKLLVIGVILSLGISMVGCKKSEEKEIKIDKGEPEVFRTEDGVYTQAGENPFSEDYKKEIEKKEAELKEKMEKEKVEIKDLTVGSGAEAVDGDTVVVHYKGWTDDGKVFDESYKRKEPFSFTLGAGNVIKGWDTGVAGMKVGGKRELTIPSAWGYGEQGMPPAIPPNATLHFTVELLEIKK